VAEQRKKLQELAAAAAGGGQLQANNSFSEDLKRAGIEHKGFGNQVFEVKGI